MPRSKSRPDSEPEIPSSLAARRLFFRQGLKPEGPIRPKAARFTKARRAGFPARTSSNLWTHLHEIFLHGGPSSTTGLRPFRSFRFAPLGGRLGWWSESPKAAIKMTAFHRTSLDFLISFPLPPLWRNETISRDTAISSGIPFVPRELRRTLRTGFLAECGCRDRPPPGSLGVS